MDYLIYVYSCKITQPPSTNRDEMPTLPSVGTRFTYSGQLGTVRFVGEVQGATGIWIGVEWDDPNRGKHDGVKGDKRYFTCV